VEDAVTDPRGAGADVMVASSDEGVRALVRLTVGDRRSLVEVADTDEAIRVVAAAPPRLAVLDAALPGAGALALARTLSRQPETREVRTLLLVSRPDRPPEDAEGVHATLALPASSLTLLRHVDQLLEARSPGAEPPR
jgi:CheY-like chemotaxis protein